MVRLSLLLTTLLLLAVPARADGLAALFPASVDDMERIEVITGPAAQAEVDRLHGKPLPAEASAIARYLRPGQGDDGRPAEVWVSRVASEAEARRQTAVMVHKMYENPRSPFKDPKRLDHDGTAVYRFTGMGQVHLIWYGGDLVWWVSAAPADQDRLLDALCR